MSESKIAEENIVAGKMLSIMAISVTTSLESFSGWLLAGSGVAFALMLTNIESISNFIELDSIKQAIFLFLFALGAGVLQRWLGAAVRAGALASSDSEQLGHHLPDDFNFSSIFKQVEKATFYPQRWLVAWQFKKLEAGDFAVAGRVVAKMAQIQGFLVLLQAGLIIYSITVLIGGLNA